MNQGFSKIWIVIILIVVGIIAIVGGGFYAWQKSTKPSITLLSPNGGEIWAIGSTYTIRWTSQNIPQTDKISIHIRRVPPPPLPETGQEFDPIISIELENTGSVNWTISDMYPVGNYIIEVNSYSSIPITKVISDESDAPLRIESSSDEIADRKVYRDEEYGYEIKYPQDWKTKERRLMSDLGHRDFVWIQSNGDEFSVDVWDFSFYSYDQLTELPPGGIDPDTIEKKEIITDSQPATELSYVVVGDGGLGARKIKKVFIQKNQLLYIISYDSKRGEQILSTFKFIEEDKTVQISVFVDMKSFDLVNKTFEGWIRHEGERAKVKVKTDDSTEFYRTSEPTWEKEYFTFSELYSNTSPTWPLTVKGIFEKEGVIKASEVFIIIQ